MARAQALSIPVVETNKTELHNIYTKHSDKNHQGVVMDAEPLAYVPIAEPEEAVTYRCVGLIERDALLYCNEREAKTCCFFSWPWPVNCGGTYQRKVARVRASPYGPPMPLCVATEPSTCRRQIVQSPLLRHRPDAGAPPIIVALDEVTDPMNMGSILRSAYCLGCAGVIVTAKNRCIAGRSSVHCWAVHAFVRPP